jgi:hypothetical protein
MVSEYEEVTNSTSAKQSTPVMEPRAQAGLPDSASVSAGTYDENGNDAPAALIPVAV